MISISQDIKNSYDIVIPVFNGIDFVRPCYESVKRHTHPQHRIIIVDDGSTEAALLSFYKTIFSDEQTIVLFMEKNSGFVKTANHGMKYSNRDIILLNSDTLVTNNWVTKLDQALFSVPDVATATPWTNNGTICSLPTFCADNPLPPGMSADDLNELAEQACSGAYPRIPTAVGFCMAIRREVIEKIGYLDEEKFDRGYGEENDFCMRAWKYGYRHVLDHNTFIHHLGSMTFKDEKRIAYIEKNLKIVAADHPNYLPMVHRFVQSDPLKPNREKIKRLIEHRQGILHILYCLHNDPFGEMGNPPGGTEYHTVELAESLYETGKIIPYLLVSLGNRLCFYSKDKDHKWIKTDIILPNEFDISTTYDPFYVDRLRDILSTYHIDAVHIQHFIHHPLDWSLLLKDWEGDLYITIHDYYPICPSFNLLDWNNDFCDGGNEEKCSSCLKKNPRISLEINLKEWRLHHSNNFSRATSIFLPSSYALNFLSRYFKDHRSKMEVLEHGIDRSIESINLRISKNSSVKKIGFLGGLSKIKGSNLIKNLILSDEEKLFHWFTIGNIGDHSLADIQLSNLTHVGRYERNELSKLLQKLEIDLIVLISIWPETFSYTLSESWTAGIPVVVGPFGAPADRVQAHQGGWIVDDLSSKSVFEKIKMISGNKSDYLEKINSISNINLTSLSNSKDKYLAKYLSKFNTSFQNNTSQKMNHSSFFDENRSHIAFYTKQHQDNIQHIHNLKQILDTTEKNLNLSHNHISNLNQNFSTISDALNDSRHTIAQLSEIIKSKDNEIQQKDNAIEIKDHAIQSIITSKSWRYTQFLRSFLNLIRRK